MPAALSFSDITMVYPDGTQALQNVSLALAPGSFTAIVGPSGCGKSTLLRLAAGLETPTSGSVAGERKSLGFVFQDPTLMPWRTVQANAELLLELEGVPAAKRRLIVANFLAIVGLSGFISHYPRQLSGGMKMRLSLARTLATKPDLLLFDEPFSALDEITRQRLVEELANLAEAQNFTGLLVTHSVAEAVYLADRVAVMSKRPGHIARVLDIDLPRPRRPEMRYQPAFVEATRQISQTLAAVAE